MTKRYKLDDERYLSKTNIFICKKKSELIEKEILHVTYKEIQ
ncbi:hypothetical protein [Clostridium botulinum]|nr:hypothetical protein [Clostridium botulinum]